MAIGTLAFDEWIVAAGTPNIWYTCVCYSWYSERGTGKGIISP